MAGFDFEVRVPNSGQRLVRDSLALAQKLAHRRGLRLRYRKNGTETYSITVDGTLPAMQALVGPLTLSVLSYAEGARSLGPRKARIRAARTVTIGYADGVDAMTGVIHESSQMFGGSPSSYDFGGVGPTHLRGHLQDFTLALARYHNLELAPRQMAEECHTIVELLLREALRLESESFAGMVNKAVDDGLVAPALKEDLLCLKDIRKRAKHRGQGVNEAGLNRLIPSVLDACHSILARLPES